MNVVLPAPFGPINPTSWPSATERSTPSSAFRPPKATEMSVAARMTAAWLPSSGGAAGTAGDRRARCLHLAHGSLGRKAFLLLLLLLPARSRDALRVDEQRDDEGDAADQQRPVAGQAEPLVEGVREEALRRSDPRDDRAGDHRDASEIGEGDQAERRQGPEAAVADRPEVVRVQRAGHPGDERRDAEARELRVADVDPGRRRGALVRADRQHALPEARAAHVGYEQGEEDRHREDEEAEDRARDLVVQSPERCPGREVEPSTSGCFTGDPVA